MNEELDSDRTATSSPEAKALADRLRVAWFSMSEEDRENAAEKLRVVLGRSEIE